MRIHDSRILSEYVQRVVDRYKIDIAHILVPWKLKVRVSVVTAWGYPDDIVGRIRNPNKEFSGKLVSIPLKVWPYFADKRGFLSASAMIALTKEQYLDLRLKFGTDKVFLIPPPNQHPKKTRLP